MTKREHSRFCKNFVFTTLADVDEMKMDFFDKVLSTLFHVIL